MSPIRLRGVRLAVAGRALFDSLDLDLEPGFTGVVGENGAGKTTLLRALAGAHPFEGGRVHGLAGARVAHCAAELHAPDDDVRAFARADEASAAALRARLSIAPLCASLSRWSTMSPGERRRLQVAAALWRAPDVLLLDEPTNHLDPEARDLLLDALRPFRGVGVLVSHDRVLLDRLTRRTLFLEHGAARRVDLAWSTARRALDVEERAHIDARERLARGARRAREALHEARDAHAGAERMRSARARMRNPDDRDGRSLGARFRADKAEKRLGRAVEVAREKAHRARARLDEIQRAPVLGRSFFLGFSPSRRPRLAALDGDVTIGPRVLLQDVHVVVRRDDRVLVQGGNGAGKSTLLARLFEQTGPERDRVFVLPQELDEEAEARALAELRAMPNEARGRVLQLVAALGVPPERLMRSARPSKGEAKKVLLARALALEASACLLDEPTNHLDLPSVERLAAALAAWPGALVVVSHDRAFAEAAGLTTTWRLRDGRLESGDLDGPSPRP